MSEVGEGYVVKIGGSVHDPKKGKAGEWWRAVGRAVEEVLGERRIVLVVGAGKGGHGIVKKSGFLEGRRDAAHKILAYQFSLLSKISRLLSDFFPVFPLSVTDLFFREGKGYGVAMEPVRRAMERGYVPLLSAGLCWGEKGLEILSGDDVTLVLARELRSFPVFVTDVEGVLDREGRVIGELRRGEEVGFWEVGDLTGGMEGKVRRIWEYGVEAVIVGLEGLGRVLRGERAGTRVVP